MQRGIFGTMFLLCIIISTPVHLTAAASLALERPTDSANSACKQQYAKYSLLVALPNSTLYEEERIEYWDLAAAALTPSCIYTPATSSEVAEGLSIIEQTNSMFAMRSGGHTPIPGSSSIGDGILLASDKLTILELDTFNGQPVARIGPGHRWIDVYNWLAEQGLVAMGGRYATVGVGGLLTGGGITYFRSVHGWAADTVINYEVVTARGTVIQVNAESNSDLFWALKGGSGNFGFITRFDIAVFPLSEVYGGNFATNETGIEALVAACAAFADTVNGGITDPLAAVNPTIQYDLDTKEFLSFTNVFYNASVATPPAAVKQFTNVPNDGSTVAGPRTFTGFMEETAVFSNNMRRLFRATSTKCTPAAVELSQKVFNQSITKLKSIVGADISITYQYMSESMVKASHAAGDAIDLDPVNGAFIAILVASGWNTTSDDAYLLNFLTALVEDLDIASKAADLYYPFIFLNDAGIGQDPIATYGGGKSLLKMKVIAEKYDPNGVFQHLSTGAFKLV